MEHDVLILASILFVLAWIPILKGFSLRFRTILMMVASGIQMAAVVIRGIESGRVPFASMYESMLLLAGLLALRLLTGRRFLPEKASSWIIPVILIINGVLLWLPAPMKIPKPLMPALQSGWMMIHVPAYFVGYVSSVLSLIYSIIILIQFKKSKQDETSSLVTYLDQEMKICYFFMWVGMITGAVWAQISWACYWFWDPKETWAMITILVASLYFFLQPSRLIPIKKALITILTFLSLVFTYWGVAFLLTGIHSY